MCNYEEIIEFASGAEVVVFCRGIEQFKDLLTAVMEENTRRTERGFEPNKMIDGRVNMQRRPKGAIEYDEFRGAYF